MVLPPSNPRLFGRNTRSASSVSPRYPGAPPARYSRRSESRTRRSRRQTQPWRGREVQRYRSRPRGRIGGRSANMRKCEHYKPVIAPITAVASLFSSNWLGEEISGACAGLIRYRAQSQYPFTHRSVYPDFVDLGGILSQVLNMSKQMAFRSQLL